MLNLTLVGNLGTDPTIGTTHKGTPIASLRVAVSQSRADTTTGERLESTEWFRVRAMGRLVDYAQRLTKGSRVLVIGRLDIVHYQSSEGEPRVGYDVWADELQSLSPRGDGGGAARSTPEHDQNRTTQPSNQPGAENRPPRSGRIQPTGSAQTRNNQDDDDLPWENRGDV